MRTRTRRISIALFLLVLHACTATPSVSSVEIILSPSSLEIAPGEEKQVIYNLSRALSNPQVIIVPVNGLIMSTVPNAGRQNGVIKVSLAAGVSDGTEFHPVIQVFDGGVFAQKTLDIKVKNAESVTPVPQISVHTYTVSLNEIKATRATCKGRVEGAGAPITVGFIYGKQPNLSKTNGTMVVTTSMDDFEITLEHLIDDTHYYYRAFALVDDSLYYYGPEESFTTLPLTYMIDGKQYAMVHITGTSVAPFAIMQTEVPPSKQIVIEGRSIDPLNDNNDVIIIQAELLRLLTRIREATGLPFRQCTSAEWLVAAAGNQEYTYSGSDNLNDVGWYSLNSGNTSHGVALKQPNGYGLYDMSGNYMEVVAPSMGEELKKPYVDIDGNLYGGCWQDSANKCTVTSFIKGDSSSQKIPGTNITEVNAVAEKTATVRLVYSLE